MLPIILASSSPRRAQLLKQIGVAFTVKSIAINEEVQPEETPSDYVLRLSQQKAQAVKHTLNQPAIIIAADTSVVFNQQIFGQPTSFAQAQTMWQQLSGNTHSVLTGVTITSPQLTNSQVVMTTVDFKPITQQEMIDYWQTGEPLGKAGGYAIQGRAAIWITGIMGDYSNVVGLPLAQTYQMLIKHLQQIG